MQRNKFGKYYQIIVDMLKDLGHEVWQDSTFTPMSEVVAKTKKQKISYYLQVLKWIENCDLVVLEVSYPSTINIGHEISMAKTASKPVLALYYQGYKPELLSEIESFGFRLVEYRLDNLEKLVEFEISKFFFTQTS